MVSMEVKVKSIGYRTGRLPVRRTRLVNAMRSTAERDNRDPSVAEAPVGFEANRAVGIS